MTEKICDFCGEPIAGGLQEHDFAQCAHNLKDKVAQLEAENERLDNEFDWSAQKYSLKAENERLKKIEAVCKLLFEKEGHVAKYIKVEGEGDTWHIPEAIGLALMVALGGE